MSATLWIALACGPLWGVAIWLRRRRLQAVRDHAAVDQSDYGALQAFGAAFDGEGTAEHPADPLPNLRREGAL